jgi:hypothetical protein
VQARLPAGNLAEAAAGLLAVGGAKELGEAAGGASRRRWALSWYARQDPAFAEELTGWAAETGGGEVSQRVIAGGDAYVPGRDQTVVNYRRPGE